MALYKAVQDNSEPAPENCHRGRHARRTALNPDNTLEAGGRVPLVEDNAANIIVAEALRESLGCEIVIAGGGQEAIDRLLNERFDLAFMDVQMAGMDDYLTKPINISQFEALVANIWAYAPKADIECPIPSRNFKRYNGPLAAFHSVASLKPEPDAGAADGRLSHAD